MNTQMMIRKAQGGWVVRAGGAVLAESDDAIELTEGDYPPVIFFPRDHIAMAFLEPSDMKSEDPFKGAASHFSIVTKSTVLDNAAYSFDTPKEGLEQIAGMIAFYPQKATVERL